MAPAAWLILGYLCGSVPFGLLITRWAVNTDVRDAGSGNIGATNVARVAGKKWGVLVLLLDAAKGALPVWAALVVAAQAPWLHAGVGFAAFLGHVFSPWLKFKGGKGVATALGVLVVLLPDSAAVGLAVYAAVMVAFRISSIGSLCAAAAAVAVALTTGRPREYLALVVALSLAVLFTHRANIQRLRQGKENRL